MTIQLPDQLSIIVLSDFARENGYIVKLHPDGHLIMVPRDPNGIATHVQAVKH